MELGLEDYFYGDGLTLIEWFERAGDLLPESVLIVKLSYIDESSREISLTSDSPSWQKKIEDFEKLVGSS